MTTDGTTQSVPAASQRRPLAKIVRVLSAMVDSGAQLHSVRSLAQATSLTPSTVHRILVSLASEGMAEQRPDGRYGLGLEFMRLAARASGRFETSSLARPLLVGLAERTGETGLLGLFDRTRRMVMIAAVAESDHALQYSIKTNEWMALHCGATGLGILAFLPDEERKTIIEAIALDRVTENTVTDAGELQIVCDQIRAKGYACTHGQRIVGAVGVSAPVYGSDERLIGDIALTLPEQRFSLDREPAYAREVVAVAKHLSALLGRSSAS